MEHSVRQYKFDNIRFILIFFVVLGHLLEIGEPSTNAKLLYEIIYSFHMPVFLFVCGYFACYKKSRLICGLLFSYVTLQILYILFSRWLYEPNMKLQFTTPYWLLWFLVAQIVYLLLLPLYDDTSVKKRTVILAASFLISLLIGYDDTISYKMSLSRILVFQPWFLLGYYYRHGAEAFLHTKLQNRKRRVGFSILLVFVLFAFLCYGIGILDVSASMMYGSTPYEKLKYGIGERFWCVLVALLWLVLFFGVIAQRLEFHIPVVSTIGRNTLSIFLLHGFVVRFLEYRHPEWLSSPVQVFLFTCGIVLVLGSTPIAKLTNFVFGGGWYLSAKRNYEQKRAASRWASPQS